MKASHTWARLAAASVIAGGVAVMGLPTAAADDGDPSTAAAVSPDAAGDAVQATGVTSANADPAAVTACAQFAAALDGASDGYGAYADSLDDNDPYANQSNVAGRTSLRQSAAAAMDAANTPGLSADISDPMRAWSVGAAKLLVKMGIGMTGTNLDSTATEVNNNAEAVQRGCAAAGTHA